MLLRKYARLAISVLVPNMVASIAFDVAYLGAEQRWPGLALPAASVIALLSGLGLYALLILIGLAPPLKRWSLLFKPSETSV